MILKELVITRVHTNVMSMTSGKHKDCGRVVLLQSGTGFVIIADDLASLQRSKEVGGVTRAFAHQSEGSNNAPLWNRM